MDVCRDCYNEKICGRYWLDSRDKEIKLSLEDETISMLWKFLWRNEYQEKFYSEHFTDVMHALCKTYR